MDNKPVKEILDDYEIDIEFEDEDTEDNITFAVSNPGHIFVYDKETDSVMDKENPEYKEYDSFQYELGRKVPFIIWTKDMKGTDLNMTVDTVMGMYDVQPTLANMFNFHNPYATVEIIDGIEHFMKEKGIEDIREIIGCVK